MVWLYPAALAGLLAVAGPILVHLLRRQQARRIVVPTVRFVRATELSAVRFRRPSDPWLLAIRAAIVACAALALARPLLLTDARTAGWSERIARVAVVDRSESARPGIDRARVDAEISTADPAIAIETTDVDDGMRRAAAWLAKSPPARREIVVFSDFQAGSLSAAALAGVPGDIGLRFSSSESAPAVGDTIRVLDGERTLAARLSLDLESTSLAYDVGAIAMDGLKIEIPPDQARSAASLLRVVAIAGAHTPSPDEPIVIRFPGAETSRRPDAGATRDAAAPVDDWTTAAADRLLRSPAIAGIDVRVTPAKNTLIVDVSADPASVEAALVVKAALDARYDSTRLHEREPRRIADTTLAAWSRPAAPADATAWRQTDESDGRWFWALALLLLVVEGIARRTPTRVQDAREPHAA